ncbi:uncharacterized protein A1O9_00712 [Exophiala aquamarina CBS 119918]|uniref:Beta-fructofuranosidase n=1 Tax=Exophiala aquamarina CBS 119918 TaxID=1182545 RepID=A0A072PRM8_9EURO|nr:uncharacterized protein A1O9_00712 [Exophiala aquamarina CBS 119918]KEF62739.1 hypothetical protein A1O9_00712 [Exophiala aquamarina CBS 119918]
MANVQNYTERYRPQYHWTPAKNWMNDPNGLIYHKGQYHMYYQYNPTGDVWGNISWGHAVSPDLLHWEEQLIALNAFETPASPLAELFFSGSAVFDEKDSSGFGKGRDAPLVAAYTSYYPNDTTLPNKQMVRGGTQALSIAYSTNDGLTWAEYEGNPVIPSPPAPYEDQWQDFRDPFVFWHEKTCQWVMAVSLSKIRKLLIYTSTDLKKWEHVSEFGPANGVGGVWECPSLFPLPLNDDISDLKWVLVLGINPGGPAFTDASATQYFVGTFDGRNFVADADNLYAASSGKANWLDYGPDYYAAATYNGLDNYERLAIAWMSDWAYAPLIPTSPWRSAMSVPRKLTLEKLNGQVRLISAPIQSLKSLERAAALYSKQWGVISSETVAIPVSGKSLDISFAFCPGKSSTNVSLGVRTSGEGNGTLIGYDFATQQMYVDRNSATDNSSFSPKYKGKYFAPLKAANGAIKLRILLDCSSVEVFGGHGESTITAQIFPSDQNTGISVLSDGDVTDVEIQIHEIQSVWSK